MEVVIDTTNIEIINDIFSVFPKVIEIEGMTLSFDIITKEELSLCFWLNGTCCATIDLKHYAVKFVIKDRKSHLFLTKIRTTMTPLNETQFFFNPVEPSFNLRTGNLNTIEDNTQATVNADRIQAGTISTSQIASHSITADRLAQARTFVQGMQDRGLPVQFGMPENSND